MKLREWMKKVPARSPDASKEIIVEGFDTSSCNVWFEEMIIQRSDKYPYAERIYLNNGLICFELSEHNTGQQSHAAKWIQKAYRNWVAERELLG